MQAMIRNVNETEWREAALSLGDEADLLSLWGDDDSVRMALGFKEPRAVFVLALKCRDGRFPSIAAMFPAASRLERTICDLYGHIAEGARDLRPWLDHGRWPLESPLGAATAHDGGGAAYPFLGAEGDGLHQIPVGPVHAGIIEPGHFRFHASGETVVRLEERLGYMHRGVDRLMRGADVATAARLAARVSGDSTVAYSWAFARAVEQAHGVSVPARVDYLRAVMAELERVANHYGDIGAICNDASFALMQAHCSAQRERVLRLSAQVFGHRLMMDAIEPGGVAVDLSRDAVSAIRALSKTLRAALPDLITLYDETASLQDRTVRTGVLKAEYARQFGAGGYVGRGSGRDFDARRDFAYAPYDAIGWRVITRADGDVNARIWVRFGEIEESLSLIEALIGAPPAGAHRVDLPRLSEPREGFALVEGFRGDVFAAVRLDAEGKVARAHLRDPSWFQWPLLEAAIEGNIVADFPLCNKSFNGSYAGVDL